GGSVSLQGRAQGTTYHIKFVQPAKAIDADRVQSDVEKLLAQVDREMSTYRADSEISRFNRAPAGEWFAVSQAVADVVSKSREISEKTGGAQDVTVEPLVKLWHFGEKTNKAPSPPAPLPTGEGSKASSPNTLVKGEVDRGSSPNPLPRGEGFRPPGAAEIRAARRRVGYKKLDVRLNPPTLRKEVDGLEVDLSSIAAGYTIDRISELLHDRGIKNFVAELGGELRAAGTRADGTPWRIAIERPVSQEREFEAAVPLVNGAMATAGGSHHFFEYHGRRYSHIIDPATGRPIEHVLASVTVAADTCIEADGWDTPLVVLGPVRGKQCAEQNGVAAMFISHTEHGDVVERTWAWRERFGGK
ncbi:MAG TPA: FAD:protein FMN transferase, partial [Lacipirellulaceae bacterium]|nr:FAD:protein FMN transferase [Lacipirellulaceae bacterium]